MPTSGERGQSGKTPQSLFGKGAECEDCLIRRQHGQPTFMRVKFSDREIVLPTGRKLDERCEACGGARRVPHARSW